MPTRCNRCFFIADLTACPICFGHHYVASCKPGTQPTALHQTDELKTKTPNTTGNSHLCNTLELLMMGIMVPETCWASNKICNKETICCILLAFYFHILTAMYGQTHIKFVRFVFT